MDAVARLDERSVATLGRVAALLEAAGWPFAVIGATAFLVHGVDLRRTTRDVDVAVAIDGGFAAVRPILLAAGLASTGIGHRFKMPDDSEIDILALDPSWSPEHEIRLADGDRIHAVGLPDAVRAAIPLELNGSRVPVAPLPLLIAVKLHAATLADRSHDLDDACAAMTAYESAGSRRFEVEYDRLESLTLETAGAFLAGRDAAQAMNADGRSALDASLDRLLETRRLSDRFVDGEFQRALVLAYRVGLGKAPDRGE